MLCDVARSIEGMGAPLHPRDALRRQVALGVAGRRDRGRELGHAGVALVRLLAERPEDGGFEAGRRSGRCVVGGGGSSFTTMMQRATNDSALYGTFLVRSW